MLGVPKSNNQNPKTIAVGPHPPKIPFLGSYAASEYHGCNLKHYFGTDGIRGVAGEPPLDPTTVFAIGVALGDYLNRNGHRRVVLGEDTRESSRWIADTLAASLTSRGVAFAEAGIIPTPGVAYLARGQDFAAGVMNSASHNPFQDNGIKIFDHSGLKLPDAVEAELEGEITRLRSAMPPSAVHATAPDPKLHESYLAYLAACLAGVDFSGMKVVVDCANGAASAVAEELFRKLGFVPVMMHASPNGRNINAGCGALHPQAMAAEVVASGAVAGVAFDGDADRAILADAAGGLVDGDRVLLIAARALQRSGRLEPPVVVGTVMTNLGLELALNREGIRLERTPVGDKYVLERMQASGARLGGEQSGHVIFGADATTGDGLLTALRTFEVMAQTGRPLAELSAGFLACPQVLLNIRVREKVPIERLDGVRRLIERAEAELQSTGRVLVRYSGTEKLARVMVEAESSSAVEAHARAIAEALRAAIGE